MSKEEGTKKGNGKTAEEQRLRIVEYKNFDLRKVKMEKNGADVTHHEGGTDAGTVSKVGESQPHPDLQNALDALKPIMARRLGLLDGTDVAHEIAKGDLDKYQIALEKEKEIISRCQVNGLTFNGKGDKFGVQITGYVKTPESGGVGLSVPRITFGVDMLGYESEAEELCEAVKVEVYAYRFQNKKAQLDLEFESKKAEQKEQTQNKGKSEVKNTEIL